MLSHLAWAKVITLSDIYCIVVFSYLLRSPLDKRFPLSNCRHNLAEGRERSAAKSHQVREHCRHSQEPSKCSWSRSKTAKKWKKILISTLNFNRRERPDRTGLRESHLNWIARVNSRIISILLTCVACTIILGIHCILFVYKKCRYMSTYCWCYHCDVGPKCSH